MTTYETTTRPADTVTATTPETAEVVIAGVKFMVSLRQTAESYESDGFPRLAAFMRSSGIVAQMFAVRPQGRRAFMVQEFAPRHGLTAYRAIAA